MALNKGRIINQYDFSGGINISQPGHLIEDNEAYAAIPTYDGTRNCYWDLGIKKRLGTLKVNTYPGPDLMKNGNCESATGPTLGVAPAAATNGTWARSSAQKKTGTYSWLLTKTTAAGAGDAKAYFCDALTTTSMNGLKVSRTYYFEGWLYTDAASTANVTLVVNQYYSATWNQTSYPATAIGSFVKVSGTFTTNAAATGIHLYVQIASAEVLNKVVYVDDLRYIDVASKIVSGYRFYRSTTPAITTFVAGSYSDETKIMYLDATNNYIEVTGGTTIPAGASVHYARWKDTLYVASGVIVIQAITYSGSWARANITGNSYYPQYIAFHKDRLWVAGGNIPQGQLQNTSYDLDTEWGGAGTSATFNVGYKDGDPITALVPLGNDLMVYKNDSIYAMVGDNISNWFLQKREDAIGCVAPRSVVDIGLGHIFLSADNIYIYDGENIAPIGVKIKPWLDTIPNNLRSKCAAVYFNNFYRLSFPSSDMTTYNNEELLLDLRYFKAGRVTWWLYDGRNISCYIACDGPSDTNTLAFTDDNEGYVRQLDIGTNDDGSNFKCEFHSKYFTFEDAYGGGGPNIDKMYDRFKVDSAQGVGDYTLVLYRNLNDEYALPITVDTTGVSGTNLGNVVVGTSLWSSQANARMTTEVALPSDLDGSALAYKLSHTGDYNNVTWYGASISYKVKRF
jgi:hypothetical protein